MRKKTTKEFKEEVFKLTRDEYTVLGEYINNETKILMKHNKCGYEYEVKPNMFLQGRRCPKCAGNLKKNTDIFKEEVFKLTGDEYTVLGEYIGASDKILMKHNKCGYEYKVKPSMFLQGRRCPKCAGMMKKNTDIFKEEVFKLTGDEYTVLGEYISNDTKILMKHNKCGYEYEVKPNSFLQGNRCPYCYENKIKLDLDEDAKICREKRKKRNNKSRKYADNYGQKWYYDDICLLEKYIEEGKTTKEIARLMGRTIASIYQAKSIFLKEKEK